MSFSDVINDVNRVGSEFWWVGILFILALVGFFVYKFIKMKLGGV